jgi:hypothetical protein
VYALAVATFVLARKGFSLLRLLRGWLLNSWLLKLKLLHEHRCLHRILRKAPLFK